MKSVKHVIRLVERAGGTVTVSRGGHLRVVCPEGLVFLPASPSDNRGIKNAERELARRGLEVKLR